MAWTMHLPKECRLGKERMGEKASSATVTAAAATTVNLSTLAKFQDEEWQCEPAWILTFQMLAFMAGPTLDTGQQVAYLQLFLLPYLLQVFCQALYRTDPAIRKSTYDLQGRSWFWPLRG